MNKKNIVISTSPIKLGQFLKLANIVSDGIEAKELIANGNIRVNGVVETRRGKKIFPDDSIVFENTTFICIHA